MPDVQAAARSTNFDEVFAESYPAVLSMATVMLSDRGRAEEVVQDAFAKAFERWSSLANPGGFVRTCVVNACKSQWRREAVLRRITPKLAASTRLTSDDEHDPYHDVLAAVSRLAPRRRAVVLLRFYEGLCEAEIAEILAIPNGTVKSTLHRALADLRAALGDWSPHSGDHTTGGV